MPQFEYEARNDNGARVSGSIHAEDERAAAHALREDDLYPVSIDKQRVSGWGASVFHYIFPVPPSGFAQFFEQLASLLRSGVNPADTFDELSALATNRRLRRVAREISDHAAGGGALADQFARYPALFDSHVPGMVEAGERLGALPEMLQQLADQYRTRSRLQGRLKWLRLYYTAVLVLAVLVAPITMMVSRGFGWYLDLLATRLVPLLAAIVAVYFAARSLNAIPWIAHLRSRIVLAIPVFGSLARWGAVARFLQTMNFAQRSGVTFHQALDLAGEAAGNEPMHRSAARAATRVRSGAGISEALSQMSFLPKHIRRMLAGGERTGELERRFEAAAEEATERREAAVNMISSGSAVAALAVSAVIVALAAIFAWRNLYAPYFEWGP